MTATIEEILAEFLTEVEGATGAISYAHLCQAGVGCAGCTIDEVRGAAARARNRYEKVRLGVVAA